MRAHWADDGQEAGAAGPRGPAKPDVGQAPTGFCYNDSPDRGDSLAGLILEGVMGSVVASNLYQGVGTAQCSTMRLSGGRANYARLLSGM